MDDLPKLYCGGRRIDGVGGLNLRSSVGSWRDLVAGYLRRGRRSGVVRCVVRNGGWRRYVIEDFGYSIVVSRR